MLKNKVAVVTGGTRGIGYAVCKKFLENGCKVAVLGSRKETVDKAVSDLLNENKAYQVLGFYPDLANEAEITDVFNQVVEKFGSLDVLVNNAGISAREPLYDYTVENFDRIIDLNLKAVFVCSKVAAKIMKQQGGGNIINTSSMVSLYGQQSGCGYPTTKFAVNGLTKSLARELGKDNIRVNAVAPGVTNTDMVRVLPKEIITPLINTIPLKRVGEPEEVANVFLFLASDMASYVTGEVLSVDGAAMS